MRTPVEDDGLDFVADSVRCRRIKADQQYPGVRVQLVAFLGKARLPIQVDIGFGDVMTPGPIEIEFPTLIDFPPPRLLTYSRETVVAEKFQAMVMLGLYNSRMKDFYDLWSLARTFICRARNLSWAAVALARIDSHSGAATWVDSSWRIIELVYSGPKALTRRSVLSTKGFVRLKEGLPHRPVPTVNKGRGAPFHMIRAMVWVHPSGGLRA